MFDDTGKSRTSYMDSESSSAAVPGSSHAPAPSAPEEPVLQDIVALKSDGLLSDRDEQRILSYATQIDITDAATIVKYGAGAQKKLADFTDEVLGYASSSDMDEISALVVKVMDTIREVDASKPTGLLGIFKQNAPKPSAVRERYRLAANDMDKIVAALKRNQIRLLKNAAMLDRLQELNTECYRELSCFVLAGRLALASSRHAKTPLYEHSAGTIADAASCNANGGNITSRFENKLHDLDVSRVICLQTAAQMQLVRDSQTAMIDRIQSIVNHTIPLWKNQMALALELADATEAARTQNALATMETAALESQADELQELSKQLADQLCYLVRRSAQDMRALVT